MANWKGAIAILALKLRSSLLCSFNHYLLLVDEAFSVSVPGFVLWWIICIFLYLYMFLLHLFIYGSGSAEQVLRISTKWKLINWSSVCIRPKCCWQGVQWHWDWFHSGISCRSTAPQQAHRSAFKKPLRGADQQLATGWLRAKYPCLLWRISPCISASVVFRSGNAVAGQTLLQTSLPASCPSLAGCSVEGTHLSK